MRRAKKVPKTSNKAAEPHDDLFLKYKEVSEDRIGPEGVEKLCRDLQVDPSDRKVLLLAWKMGAQQMGFFSKSEFEQGLRLLSAHDLPTLKASLNQVAIKVDNDPDIFQSFYQFAFKFCLTVRALTSLKGCFARCTQLGLCCCALSWLGCHTWIPRVI
ncbi:hypothetical protein ABBQ38_014198 [Trebouxia sp. C0009 RCD-2024]